MQDIKWATGTKDTDYPLVSDFILSYLFLPRSSHFSGGGKGVGWGSYNRGGCNPVFREAGKGWDNTSLTV